MVKPSKFKKEAARIAPTLSRRLRVLTSDDDDDDDDSSCPDDKVVITTETSLVLVRSACVKVNLFLFVFIVLVAADRVE